MAVFKLQAQAVVTCYTDVEAETEKEAIEIAEQRAVVFGPGERKDRIAEMWVIDMVDDADVDDINDIT